MKNIGIITGIIGTVLFVWHYIKAMVVTEVNTGFTTHPLYHW